MANEITVRVKAEDSATATFQKVGKEAQGLGKVLGDVGKIAGGFLAANVVAGVGQKLSGFIGDSIKAAQESKEVNAQLEAVLKSTGSAAGLSADHIRDRAAQLEKASKFEDEAILNGQNLLLTFTNIKGTRFDEATQTMLDMAQALGTDAAGSAIQLGKALNDPKEGISALTRVGVTFTEEQKNQIEAMQEAGDIAGAQGIILAELNKEFGGSAKAASDAAGAQEKYKDKMNDLKEQIGTKMLPIQEKWMELQAAAVTFIADKGIPLLEELYAKHYPAIAKAVQDVSAIIEEYWPQISAIISFAIDYVKTRIEGLIQYYKAIIENVINVVQLLTALFHGDWARVWDEMKQIASTTIDGLVAFVRMTFGNIPQIIIDVMGEVAGKAYDLGKNLADSVINGIGNLAERVAKKVGGALDSVSVMGISPKDVLDFGTSPFRAAGGPVTGGRPYVVGEQGPELFVPGQSGAIVPNDMLGGSSARTVVNVNVYNAGSVLSERDLVQVVRDAILGGALRGVVVTP